MKENVKETVILGGGNEKTRAAVMSGVVNGLLVLVKIIIGLLSGSISILAEAAHSGVDLLASLLAYYAVSRADIPPDDFHAYGHGKIENLSATLEAVLVVITALAIIYESVKKFFSPTTPEFLLWGILIMVFSIVINWIRTRKLYKVAEATGSDALRAAALHHEADIWTSAGVLVGLAIIYFTGWVWVDPALAILMAAVIFKAGYTMTKDNMRNLIDISLPKEEEEEIFAIANSRKEIYEVHRLRTRRSGSWRQIDMHIVFQKDVMLSEAHAVCDKIEKEIKAKFDNCTIVLHPEPKKEKMV